MNRREALWTIGAAAAIGWQKGETCETAETSRTGLGLVSYSRSRLRTARLSANPDEDLFRPLPFLRHCDESGAGGAQVALGRLDQAAARELRQECETRGLFLEAIISLPQTSADLDRFRAEMQSAQAAGARAVRCVLLPGRRYEQFRTREAFLNADTEGRKRLLLAAPIADDLQLPLAVENHKDHRDDERVQLFESISSEFVGACVDTGNSLALLEDPLETARKFAPWAHAVHLKDQAVQPCADGFLLGDVPLGGGALDLPHIVEIVRQAKPGIPMALELITRDPLTVPCLREDYWSTLPDLPAQDLARTLRLVRTHAAERLPTVSDLTPEDQVAVESANVAESLRYARQVLQI